MSPDESFPTEIEGLPEAGRPGIVELADGVAFDLRIAPVAKRVGTHELRMLAYNGSIPGPVLKVKEGSEIVVNVENHGDLETTVHWHGLRLDNRFDGTHQTQPPIPVGGSFTVRCRFPDPGVYWYHPHIRQDYGQEMGLYGNLLVEPVDPHYWPPVHREIALTLDDILIEGGKVAPFSRAQTTYAAMGRFGDVLLIGGETELSVGAQLGEVVRFYLTNTANTRVFNVALPGARMKLVGGDSGRVEHEQIVKEVVLAPSERAVVDVRFEQAGELTLEHRTQRRTYPLAAIAVGEVRAEPSLGAQFDVLRTNEELVAARERAAPYLDAEPDKTLAFIAEMDGHAHEHAHGHGHHHHAAGGIEWEDDMVELNRLTTSVDTRWKVIDRGTGAENAEIDWRFRVGDQVKIRLLNEMAGDHPMHHPFHIHGAGRFLVLSRDGVIEPNLVWKDTVLVRTGETVDILLDVSNPGLWMAHCHIAEHHESGMMFSFEVTE
jgi:FtsP/CotA-like multicopper oxidase with cupredoxin domain